MTETSRLALGLLEPFHAAGIVGVPDVQVAAALMRIGGGDLHDPDQVGVALGAALCVRALRAGSVCIDLRSDPVVWAPDSDPITQNTLEDLPWPDADAWLSAVKRHPLVATDRNDTPLRLAGTRLYLQRYWQDEEQIRVRMLARSRLMPVDEQRLTTTLTRLFNDPGADRQRLAAATCALRQSTIIAGGPGTGKTTTVARIIAALRDVGTVRSVALAAPTGKAAARLQEAVSTAATGMAVEDQQRVADITASTLHRLLGWRPDAQGRFRHDASNPLPHDLVIVDETSMVSLPLMARLLEAVRPDARLLLVGDPDQLASIDAGAVLGDLVSAPAPAADSDVVRALQAAYPEEDVDRVAATGVVVLNRNYRFDAGIAHLASAIRSGDPDAVLQVLTSGYDDVEFVAPGDLAGVREDVITQASDIAEAARAGDAGAALAGLDSHRILCAHREGPFGVAHWDDLINSWTTHLFEHTDHSHPWFAGQSLLVTANDYAVQLYNGDTGVVVAHREGLRAAFGRGTAHTSLPVSQLGQVQTLGAMTIHRGQGSQFDLVTVVLPDADSPLLSRELLYTAVTRARTRIRVVGTQQAVRAGVVRHVRRASGLRSAPID